MLGHASITLTMDTYSHVLPGMQEESAARLDELLTGAHRSSDHIRYAGEPRIKSTVRALALQARWTDPDFRNSPVGIRDSSTRPEYGFLPIHGVRVP